MPNIKENTKLLIQAAETGDIVEVQRLIPISDPKSQESEALQFAVYYGHIECVKLLIPVSNPKDRYSSALQLAAQRGHTQCVELLIPVSNPKEHNSRALCLAAENGRTECIELLYPVSDPKVAIKQLQHLYPDNYNKWGPLYEMVDAERVRNTLTAEVGTATTAKVQRKM